MFIYLFFILCRLFIYSCLLFPLNISPGPKKHPLVTQRPKT